MIPLTKESSLSSLTNGNDKIITILADAETQQRQQHGDHEEWIQQWIEQGDQQQQQQQQQQQDKEPDASEVVREQKEQARKDEEHHHLQHHHHQHHWDHQDRDEEKKEEVEQEQQLDEDHDRMDELESLQMVRKMLNVQHPNDYMDAYYQPEEPSYCELFGTTSNTHVGGDCNSSRDEMAQFVASNHDLWTMLSLQLGLSKQNTTRVATEIAMLLATTGSSTKGNRFKALQSPLSKQQYTGFRRNVLDTAGAQEFFVGSVFVAFHCNKTNAALNNAQEVDQFLNILYLGSSFFQGGPGALELPSKDDVRTSLLNQLDNGKNNNEDHGDINKQNEIRLQQIHTVIKTSSDAANNVVDTRTRRKDALPLQEREEDKEWDFCEWLDRLFFGERPEGKPRDTICMRLSRHGSSRHGSSSSNHGMIQRHRI